MVVALVKMLVEEGKFELRNIGVITPFRAQIVEIKRDMPQEWLEDEEFIIDTVERFQGRATKRLLYFLPPYPTCGSYRPYKVSPATMWTTQTGSCW